MADLQEKVSALPTVVNATATDLLYAVQNGVSVQETMQQLLDLSLDFIVLAYPGNPNGHLAGEFGQLCLDDSNLNLYICTFQGSAPFAIWTKIGSSNQSNFFTWNTISNSTQQMSANNGYFCNSTSLITLTLPVTSEVGDKMSVLQSNTGSWKIMQNPNQYITGPGCQTTVGTAGFLSSNNQYDGINLVCSVANTTWEFAGPPMGALNYG